MKNLNTQCRTFVTLNFDRSTCKWTLSLHMKKKQLHCFATLTGYTSKPESKLAFRCMLTALWEAEIKHNLFPFASWLLCWVHHKQIYDEILLTWFIRTMTTFSFVSSSIDLWRQQLKRFIFTNKLSTFEGVTPLKLLILYEFIAMAQCLQICVELIGTPSMIIDAITLIIMNVPGSNATIISKYQHHILCLASLHLR